MAAAIKAIAEYHSFRSERHARLRQQEKGRGAVVLSAAALVPALLEETLWIPLGKAAQKILNVFNRV